MQVSFHIKKHIIEGAISPDLVKEIYTNFKNKTHNDILFDGDNVINCSKTILSTNIATFSRLSRDIV